MWRTQLLRLNVAQVTSHDWDASLSRFLDNQHRCNKGMSVLFGLETEMQLSHSLLVLVVQHDSGKFGKVRLELLGEVMIVEFV